MNNRYVEIRQTVLYINQTPIPFRFPIADILVLEHRVVVLLQIPGDDTEMFNLFSVGFDGVIQWQVQKRSAFRKKAKTPFVGIRMKDGKIMANDFYGIRYLIDPENGTIVGRDPETNGKYW